MPVKKFGERGQNTVIITSQIRPVRASEERGQQGTAKPNVSLPKGGSGTAPPKPPPSN